MMTSSVESSWLVFVRYQSGVPMLVPQDSFSGFHILLFIHQLCFTALVWSAEINLEFASSLVPRLCLFALRA